MKNAWKSPTAGAALIVLLTMVAYFPALRCGFIWNDDTYVTENQTLRSLHGLESIWVQPQANEQYYPMVFTSFWVEYHLWKLQPFGYHLVNVLLHAANALLFWRVLRQLSIPGAWWAAVIFAVHPVTVESVAWITERKNVLSGLFYLLALLAFFRFRPLTGPSGERSYRWQFYPLVLVLSLCALLSKTVTCSLPAVLILLVWWKGRVERRDVLALVPLFVLGAALGLVTVWLEKHHVGASGSEWALSFGERWLVAGRAFWFYAGKLFWPRTLAFIYPRWEIDLGTAWQYLFPLAVLVLLATLWLLRTRLGKGPLVAVLFFGITLAPALGFVNVYPFRYSYVADHFQYLASLGIIAYVVSGIAYVLGRWKLWPTPVGNAMCAGLLLTLGGLTWGQAHVYRDSETLWRDTLAKSPSAWIAHNNLGVLLENQNREAEAQDQYEEALRLQPDYVEAHNNLGFALSQAGHIEEAIAQFKIALRIDPSDIEARNNLGNALSRTGRPEEAIAQYEVALRIKPDYVDAHNNLGTVLLRLGRMQEAIGHWETALRIKPDYPEAANNLGVALARSGRAPEAIRRWEQALRLKPDYADAHYNLGIALEQAGQVQQAIGHYEQSLRCRPNMVEAQNRLARLRAVQ